MSMSTFKSSLRNAFTAVLLVVFLYARQSASSSAIEVSPSKPTVVEVGGSIILSCKYDVEDISNVQWFGPRKNRLSEQANVNIRPKDGKSVLSVSAATPSDSGIYQCVGSSKSIEKDVVSKTEVTVFQPIKFVNTSKIQKFEKNTKAIVQCSTSGNPPGEIEWEKNGTTISQENSSRIFVNSDFNLVIPDITMADEGIYKCDGWVVNVRGQHISLDIFVDVQSPPSNLRIRQSSKKVVKGANIKLTCFAIGEPAPSYDWYFQRDVDGKNSTLITDGIKNNGSILELNDVQETDAGNYTCMAKNERGDSSLTKEVTVFVPPTITKVVNATVSEGTIASIECFANGVPKPNMTIYRDGKLLKELTVNSGDSIIPEYVLGQAVVTFDKAQYSDRGLYECRADNGVQKAAIALLSVEVEYPPRNASLPTVYGCVNETAVLSCRYDAYPPPNLIWGVMENVTGQERVVAEWESKPTEKFVPLNTTSLYNITRDNGALLLTINKVEPELFKKYYCKAENKKGLKTDSAELVEATLPERPTDVQVIEISTKKAMVTFNPPSDPGATIIRYEIVVTNKQTNKELKYNKLVDGEKTSGRISYQTPNELTHNTKYFATVTSVNCRGLGNASEKAPFNTDPIVKPGKVKITSLLMSKSANNYTVSWQPQGDGNGTLQKFVITFQLISEDKSTNRSKEQTVVISSTHSAFFSKAYVITNLEPDSKYNLSITVYNEVGSAEATMEFKTASGKIASQTDRIEGESSNPEATTQWSEPKTEVVTTEKLKESTTKVDRKTTSPATSQMRVIADAKSEMSVQKAFAATEKVEDILATTRVIMKGRVQDLISGGISPYVQVVGVESVVQHNSSETNSLPSTPRGLGPKAGGFDAKLIIIIIVIIIALLILIDFGCCMLRQCGVFHCIYAYTCAPACGGKSEKAAEEGSAEFRKESDGVTEQTPLQNVENGDNAVKDEKPTEKTSVEISPDDVKMEVCSSEKELLA